MTTLRLYAIGFAPYEVFHVGRCRSQQQVLIGIQFSKLVALFFAQDGTIAGAQTREPVRRSIQYGARFHDTEVEMFCALEAWELEIGFTPATIHVQKFDHDGTRIEDRPSYFGDFAVNPVAHGSEVDILRTREYIEQWDRNGNFVLYWCKDYWMNADGTIEST